MERRLSVPHAPESFLEDDPHWPFFFIELDMFFYDSKHGFVLDVLREKSHPAAGRSRSISFDEQGTGASPSTRAPPWTRFSSSPTPPEHRFDFCRPLRPRLEAALRGLWVNTRYVFWVHVVDYLDLGPSANSKPGGTGFRWLDEVAALSCQNDEAIGP